MALEGDDSRTVVRVGCYENGAYMAVDEQGVRSGYDVEYLNQLSHYGDWTYDYVDFGSWEEAFAALKAGQVDVLPSLYEAEAAEDGVLFSEASLCDIYGALSVRLGDDRYAYDDFEAFSGMSVGVIQGRRDGRDFVDYAKQQGFDVQVTEYRTLPDLLAALRSGQVDGVAASHLGSNSEFRIVSRYTIESQYLAVAPGKSALLESVDKAMRDLDLRDPNFSATLVDSYLGLNTDQDPLFTKAEYAYLEHAPVLRVSYDESCPPLAYTDPETGEFVGAVALLFDDISRITGLRFEFIAAADSEEAVRLVEEGRADLVADVPQSNASVAQGSVVTTGSYLRDPMARVVSVGRTGSRVALPNGFTLSSDVSESTNEAHQTAHYATQEDCLDALVNDEADVAYVDVHVANYLLAESRYDELGVSAISGYSREMSIGALRGADDALMSLLDRCVRYTSERRITAWLSQSSLDERPIDLAGIVRKYPLQAVCGVAVLFALVLGVVMCLARIRLRAARHVRDLTFADPLTGGWTLARFRADVEGRLEDMQDGAYAILYLDIKRFKSFNAAFGYSVGDELLQGLDRVLGDATSSDEPHAHITADEFVVLVRWEGIDALLERFTQIDRRFNNLPVLVSLAHRLVLYAGVCVIEGELGRKKADAMALSTFIDCARYARDSIGETSRSVAALYSRDMKERDIAERAMTAVAHDALESGEFVAYYQPKVELASNRVTGFEALARWEAPGEGVIPPSEFIPLFEKNGLVVELDLYLLRLACKRVRGWLDKTGYAPTIACNFSRLHLADDAFPETLKAIVDECGVPIDHLELELTESIVMEDLEHAKRVCQRLKDLGFRISIDDFGSGYSSLGTLLELPIDVLKLDRSFLMSSQSGERSRAILEGVVGIAVRLGVRVVVEGVETCEQASMLAEIDDRIVAQGFLYSHPVPLEESDVQFAEGVLEPQDGCAVRTGQ